MAKRFGVHRRTIRQALASAHPLARKTRVRAASKLDRCGAELLFHVLTEREEQASVAIATNESFSGWTKTVTDPRLCAAIVDRLTFHGTIIETGTDSYRMSHTRTATHASS